MTREKFEALCRECCRQSGLSECLFADADVGFIDTSAECDGSRGIAFSKRKMMVNFDGTVKNVAYCKIRSVQIISSMEDAFADELEISGEHSRLRISDYSIDKLKLKQLIEGLIEGIEEKAAETVPEIVEKAAEIVEENAAGYPVEKVDETIPETIEGIAETVAEKVPETAAKAAEKFEEPVFQQKSETPVIEEQHASEPFPVDGIEWLNGAVKAEEKVVAEEKIEWLSGMSNDEKPPEIRETPTDTEAADREFIEQMSHEETLDFLSKALNEINNEPVSEKPPEIVVKPDTNALLVSAFPQNPPEEKTPEKSGGLSKEPVWGDIYIKASRSLRELCESGKLSMNVIENELREKLLDSANAFAKIIADEQKVPKTLIPKIAELKNAAENFDEYFAYGEDVGVRVMFFMLYQMLSYADRIAENPDTKEPLNDFFRRFGTAGITLSMLDVRG